MKYLKSEILILILMAIPFIYLAIIWGSLPAEVPVHFDINGEVDRMGSKTTLPFMLLLLAPLTYLIFLLVPKIDPKGKIKNMGAKYQQLKFIMVLFMSIISVLIIYSSQQGGSDINWIFVVVGLFIAALGNYFQTIKHNYFIGIRTPWTLENEQVWKSTHRLGGKLWMLGGVLMAVFPLLVSNKDLVGSVFVGLVLLISIVPIVYSYLAFRKIQVGV